MDTMKTKKDFLEQDLYNALKELFIGTVTWQANPQEKNTHYLRDLGMFTCFVQARALYEFFYKPKEGSIPQNGDTASAHHFASSWRPSDLKGLYLNYMANKTPAQKRVFHLVYGRSTFPGGTSPDESDHLRNQVLAFAKDLHRLTKEFAQSVEAEYRALVEGALQKALNDAKTLAEKYGITNPLAES
jgi:hypothetical protein